MSSILTALQSLATTAMTLLGDVVTAITNSPLLLLFAIIGLVGLGIGIYKRIVA